MTKRFAIKIAYLGKNYQGFQRQKGNVATIEDTIIYTLKKIGQIESLKKARYTAAGRTDQGVNALGQVIAFDSLQNEIHLDQFNHFLPKDIFAWAITSVKPDFHARNSALQRFYRYFAPYSGEDIKLMKQAAKKLLGTHDFIKFCKPPDKLSDGSDRLTKLTLEKAEVLLLKEKNLIQFNFSSKSFLWKQIRKMVTILLAIGRKEYPITIIDEVFDTESIEPKGGISPAQPEGLVLYDVSYPEVVFTKIEKLYIIEKQITTKISSYTATLAALKLLKDEIIK
ncbi:MAG: tRNA pseudouridine(38-40) synthase TruA [Candidatus Heimdallarchaeota archaeon]